MATKTVPYRLIRFALQRSYREPRMFRVPPSLKRRYDAVIIGGGGHGLACAYYLARDHGMQNIAVLEQGYIGSGGTGRNTAIIRSNYLTPEGVNFYEESVQLFRRLSSDLNFNLLYSQRGHFTLAHTDSALRTMRWRAEVNKHLGVNSMLVDRTFITKACPLMDLDCGHDMPVMGALWHPPGAIARHDAVAWAYARGADRLGVEIHQHTRVTGLQLAGNRVTGVKTERGVIETDRVVSAVAGYTPTITEMVGVKTPLVIHPLQACVTEPLKPWLDVIVVSGSFHIYVSQSSRGEMVMGASLDPYEVHSTRSTLEFVEGLSAHVLSVFPHLGGVKVLRQWAGLADMTPDFSPIMGLTSVEGFYLDAGWGTWGFKATPASGSTMAFTVANGRPHPLIEPFRLSRFSEYELVGEKGAASVGH